MLASRGMHTAFRLLANASKSGGQARTIHIPPNLFGRKAPIPPGARGQNVLAQARMAFNRLLFGAKPISPPAGFVRSIHLSQPIRAQLSFPARHALRHSPALPRAPGVPRGIAQVGLGTVRNFSSARPIFQAIAENVPITARAMYEMDLDAQKQMQKARKAAKRGLGQENGVKKSSEKLKVRKDDFDHYFAIPEVETTATTTLTIPLTPFDPPTFEIESSIADVEAASRSSKVSMLFRKLEDAGVWTNGAHYEAFGPADPGQGSGYDAGMCTVLKVVFDGWTADDVGRVIGKDGRGWCTIREVNTNRQAPASVTSSRPSTPHSYPTGPLFEEPPLDQFVMPTLDFSSAFAEHNRLSTPSTPATIFSDFEPHDMPSGFVTPFSDIGTPWSDISRPGSAMSFIGSEESNGDADEWGVHGESLEGNASERQWMGLSFSANISQRREMFSNF